MDARRALLTGDSAKARAIAEVLRRDGWNVIAVAADASIGESADALVCCHTQTSAASWLDCSLEEWRELRTANLDSMFAYVQTYANATIADGRQGAVVLVAPNLADAEADDQVLSAVTAWGVRGLVRNASDAYARKGVRINAVCAGDGADGDVAELVRFMLCEGAHITGQTLPVADGRALL